MDRYLACVVGVEAPIVWARIGHDVRFISLIEKGSRAFTLIVNSGDVPEAIEHILLGFVHVPPDQQITELIRNEVSTLNIFGSTENWLGRFELWLRGCDLNFHPLTDHLLIELNLQEEHPELPFLFLTEEIQDREALSRGPDVIIARVIIPEGQNPEVPVPCDVARLRMVDLMEMGANASFRVTALLGYCLEDLYCPVLSDARNGVRMEGYFRRAEVIRNLPLDLDFFLFIRGPLFYFYEEVKVRLTLQQSTAADSLPESSTGSNAVPAGPSSGSSRSTSTVQDTESNATSAFTVVSPPFGNSSLQMTSLRRSSVEAMAREALVALLDRQYKTAGIYKWSRLLVQSRTVQVQEVCRVSDSKTLPPDWSVEKAELQEGDTVEICLTELSVAFLHSGILGALSSLEDLIGRLSISIRQNARRYSSMMEEELASRNDMEDRLLGRQEEDRSILKELRKFHTEMLSCAMALRFRASIDFVSYGEFIGALVQYIDRSFSSQRMKGISEFKFHTAFLELNKSQKLDAAMVRLRKQELVTLEVQVGYKKYSSGERGLLDSVDRVCQETLKEPLGAIILQQDKALDGNSSSESSNGRLRIKSVSCEGSQLSLGDSLLQVGLKNKQVLCVKLEDSFLYSSIIGDVPGASN